VKSFDYFTGQHFRFCPSGPFGWTLARARRLPFKPVKGQLKFFNPNF